MSTEPPYDRSLRRDTPLALKLKTRIRNDGPILLADYMQACLWDEAHGYYATRSVIGRDGDFITAPEISQAFGELLGLWSAVVWQQMGAPAQVTLAEAGPGRGTLMQDALRAARRLPGFAAASRLRLIERSPTLRALQQQALAADRDRIEWSETGDDLPPPLILLANELLDCCPVEQAEKTATGWRLRRVGLDAGGQLALEASGPPAAVRPAATPDAPLGSIHEFATMSGPPWLPAVAAHGPVAGLFIDYGHLTPSLGETLQAVRAHRFEDILTSPGEADLSAQVDFAAFATAATASGLAVDGPVTQSEFLGSLGIMERASKLISANPAKANAIEMAVARLMNPNAMGGRFKVIGVRSPHLPPLPGFPTSPR